MNEDYISEILALLEVYYPNHFKDYDDIKIQMTIKVWTEKFKEVDPKLFRMVVERIANKSKFFPTVAEIIFEIEKIKSPELYYSSAEEEWEIVIESIRLYGQYDSGKAFEMFKPLTKEIVKEIGYYHLCVSELIQADRKRFIELYNSKISRFKELKVLGNTKTLEEEEMLLKLENTVLGIDNSSLIETQENKGGIKKIEFKD